MLRDRLRAEAKASLLGALAILPSHIPSLRHLAGVYRSEGNTRMAEKMLRDLVGVDPMEEQSWQDLGVLLADQGDHERAIECFDVAAAVNSPIIPFSVIPRVLHL
jgi:tetratricopeptide (TPR) repeat protein